RLARYQTSDNCRGAAAQTAADRDAISDANVHPQRATPDSPEHCLNGGDDQIMAIRGYLLCVHARNAHAISRLVPMIWHDAFIAGGSDLVSQLKSQTKTVEPRSKV